MSNNKLFIGKANYEFGSRYVLLHVDSAVCINFNNPVSLHNHLVDNYGTWYRKKIMYDLPEPDKIDRIKSIRAEKGLDKVVYEELSFEDRDIIESLELKIMYNSGR